MDYLENKGLKLTIQRGDRVFPKSEKSNDVIKLFEKLIKEKDIDLKLNENVNKIYKDKDLNKFIVLTQNNSYEFDKVVIATGGLSYPLTGSTGDGINLQNIFLIKLLIQNRLFVQLNF